MNNLIEKAIKTYESTPNGQIVDADTILADIMQEQEFDFEIFQDLVNIYKNSNDKSAVCQMFYEFTGVEFEDYLRKCITETTKDIEKECVA